ncbi:MAG: hypothetical protein SFU56_04270 [Capsulimonadales bacterium]|nr:hypothetical protein [Capsulimonadales bacterium]
MRPLSLRPGPLTCLMALLVFPLLVTPGALSQIRPAKRADLRTPLRSNLAFSDLTGREHRLVSTPGGPSVFFFLSIECPIANRYTSRILAMERAFKPLGIRFFAVYPNENESAEEIRQHAADWGLTCPVIRDDGRLVRHFGVTMTPEAAITSPVGATVYVGRIDDNADSEKVRSRDLAKAVLAAYRDLPVPRTRTRPFGCPIRFLPREQELREAKAKPAHPPATVIPSAEVAKATPAPDDRPPASPVGTNLTTMTGTEADRGAPERPAADLTDIVRRTAIAATGTAPLDAVSEPARPAVARTSVTYTRDVAPILFQRCLPCHRTGEVAPFRIDTYEQAVAWAGQIREATAARRMPPWKADSRGQFHDEMRLTNREIAILSSWANGGTPYGRKTEMPLLPSFPAGWRIGDPDAILAMPEEYEVPADGRDLYRCFVIPTRFSEDRWVSGIEYVPGNRTAVHHVSAWVDTSGKARQLDDAAPGPGYTNPTPANGPGFSPVAAPLGGWVPGHYPRKLPAGVGIFLPKGADIVLEVHYHPSGRPEKDRTRFGLHFSRDEVTKRLYVGDVTNPNFRIPPGAERYPVEAYTFLPDDITLLSISPHMHYVGRSMKVTATLPSGVTQVLVDVPDWDFRWQPSYRFKQPLRLPRRTRIDMIAHFDNSEKNPNNPNRPPREMRYGEQTTDEMCTVFMAYTLDREDVRTETAPQGGGK